MISCKIHSAAGSTQLAATPGGRAAFGCTRAGRLNRTSAVVRLVPCTQRHTVRAAATYLCQLELPERSAASSSLTTACSHHFSRRQSAHGPHPAPCPSTSVRHELSLQQGRQRGSPRVASSLAPRLQQPVSLPLHPATYLRVQQFCHTSLIPRSQPRSTRQPWHGGAAGCEEAGGGCGDFGETLLGAKLQRTDWTTGR